MNSSVLSGGTLWALRDSQGLPEPSVNIRLKPEPSIGVKQGKGPLVGHQGPQIAHNHLIQVQEQHALAIQASLNPAGESMDGHLLSLGQGFVFGELREGYR